MNKQGGINLVQRQNVASLITHPYCQPLLQKGTNDKAYLDEKPVAEIA